jgi:hypothetical protein
MGANFLCVNWWRGRLGVVEGRWSRLGLEIATIAGKLSIFDTIRKHLNLQMPLHPGRPDLNPSVNDKNQNIQPEPSFNLRWIFEAGDLFEVHEI